MPNGDYFPAEDALAGRFDLLVDGTGAVFTDQSQTINMQIEVSGPFVTPVAITHLISTDTVAGIRWVGEHQISGWAGWSNCFPD